MNIFHESQIIVQAEWRQATTILCDYRVLLWLKGHFYRKEIRPSLVYGAKCWLCYMELKFDWSMSLIHIILTHPIWVKHRLGFSDPHLIGPMGPLGASTFWSNGPIKPLGYWHISNCIEIICSCVSGQDECLYGMNGLVL